MDRLKTTKLLTEIKELLVSENQIEASVTSDLNILDLINKSILMFKWKNVPDTITVRTIEKRMFFAGKLCFFYDDNFGFQIMPFAYMGGINDENEFTRLKPISLTGIDYKEKIINEEAVVIRDNELEIPPFLYAKFYGNKITELFNIREKNNNWLSLPFIFSSTGDRLEDKKRGLEIKEIMYNGKQEIAYITDAFNALQLFDLKPQYFGTEIEEQIRVMKNNYLEYLGVDHLTFDKKERMITQEIEVKNEENTINLEKRLAPRKNACKLINEIWGLNIDVEYAFKFDTLKEEKEEEEIINE